MCKQDLNNSHRVCMRYYCSEWLVQTMTACAFPVPTSSCHEIARSVVVKGSWTLHVQTCKYNVYARASSQHTRSCPSNTSIHYGICDWLRVTQSEEVTVHKLSNVIMHLYQCKPHLRWGESCCCWLEVHHSIPCGGVKWNLYKLSHPVAPWRLISSL